MRLFGWLRPPAPDLSWATPQSTRMRQEVIRELRRQSLDAEVPEHIRTRIFSMATELLEAEERVTELVRQNARLAARNAALENELAAFDRDELETEKEERERGWRR